MSSLEIPLNEELIDQKTLSSTTKDKFEIKCPSHSDETVLICIDNNCNNESYICKVCVEIPDCEKNNHILIPATSSCIYDKLSISFTYDYKKIKNLIKEVKEINISILKDQFYDTKKKILERSNERLEKIRKNIKSKVEAFNYNTINEIENIKKQSSEIENSETDIVGKNLPETMNIDEIKKLFEKAIQNNQLNKQSFINEVESIIGIIKKVLDNDKVTAMFKEMENLVYFFGLSEKSASLDKLMKEKIDIAVKALQQQFKEFDFSIIDNKKTTIITSTNNQIFFDSDPSLLNKEVLISDKSQKSYTIDSIFTCFTAYDSSLFIAYATQSYTIDLYDLISNKIVQTMKNHIQHIFIVRHFFCKKTNTDFLLSTGYDKKVNIWSYNLSKKQFDLKISINTGHAGLYLYSGIILFDELQKNVTSVDDYAYIVTSVPNEQMKVFSFKGAFLKHIGNKNDYSYFIDSHLDNESNSYHIINANSSDIKAISYVDGNTVKTFKDIVNAWHMCALIVEFNSIVYLIESDGAGWIRLWNYNEVKIFKKIFTATNCNLRGIVLWNDKYLIAASSDKSTKIISILEEKVIHSQICHDNVLCTVQKLHHPIHGEVYVTCAIDGKLKMWI